MKAFALLLLVGVVTSALADQRSESVVCTYAPSQSNVVAGISGAAGGAGATTSAVGSALGLSVVTHSSGAAILTGGSGYIAGTIGTAGALPVIVTVGLLVGGAAVSVELICAKENHPEQVAKIKAASEEFAARFSDTWKRTKLAVGDKRAAIRPAAERASAKVWQMASDVWEYAYRKGAER